MKKIILIICLFLLIGCIGCTNNDSDDLLEERNDRLDLKYERMQEEWNLRDQTNMTCVFDNCLEKCDFNMSVDMMNWDYNKDGIVDDFEFETYQSWSDRKTKCFHSCTQNDWKYMGDCRNNTV